MGDLPPTHAVALRLKVMIFSLWDLAEASLQTNPNQIVGIYMIYNDIVYLECFIPYIYHLELLLVAGRGLPSRSVFDVGNLRY